MAYPSIDDYGNILSLPPGRRTLKRGVSDLDLANQATIIPGNYYLHRDAGQFAVVYQCRSAQGVSIALRCLLAAPPSDVIRRSTEQQSYLKAHPIPYLVRAGYFEDAIQVLGTWHPVFTMEWVEGVTLAQKVQELCAAGDRLRLLALSGRWERMMAALRDARIAHGDLHPQNVLVRSADEELRLVDYDTLFVPSLCDLQSPIAGCEGYVHPCYLDGTPRPFDEKMDTFGAVVIWLSLQALASDQNVYGKYTSDNLFFAADDLKSPDKSPAFDYLVNHSDPCVARTANILRAECRRSVESGTLAFAGLSSRRHHFVPDLTPPPPGPMGRNKTRLV